MRVSRPIVISGALLSFSAYVLAVWSEAARTAAGLGFSEWFGVGRLLEGFGKVTLQDLLRPGFESWEYLSLGGMLVAFVAAAVGMERVSRWVPAGYLAILVLMGGWKGLLMGIYLPLFLLNLVLNPLPMDGEFFEERIARYMGAGVWVVFLLGWSLAGFIKWRPKWMKSPEMRSHV